MGIKKRTGSYFFSSNTVVNCLILSLFFALSLNAVQAQTVAITADRDGFEGGQTGRFLITVSDFGFTFLDNIDVRYSVSGTAIAGGDYVDLPSYDEDDDIYEINISYGALGANSAFVVVTVIEESLVDGLKDLTITLLPDGDYILGSPIEATITLFDNDECPTTAPVLDAGEPTTFCDVASVNLNNYTNTPAPVNSVLTWSTNGDPAVVAGHLADPTNVTLGGTYYGFFRHADTSCPNPPVLPVTLTFNTSPTINSTTPDERCGPGSVTLEATASGGTINWYDALNDVLPAGAGNSFATPSLATTTTYYVSATLNGCESPRLAVVATIIPIPTITGTTPGNRCGPGTVTLEATASAGTLSWFSAPTGGSSLGTGTSFTTPSISETTTYYVEATNNGCTTPTRSTVIATVNPAPSITNTTPGSRCGPGSVTLEATATSGGTINWYNTAGSVLVLGTGPTFNTPSIVATRNYFVSVTLDGCTSERTEVQATVNALPTITGTTPASNCGPGSVTLGAVTSAGTINWFASETGGTSLFTGTSFITPEIATTTTYYVEATANGCTSPTRTPVVATISIPLSAGTPTNTSSCNDNDNGVTIVDLDNLLTGADAGNWTYTSGPQNNVPFNGQNIVNFNDRPDGNYVFTFTTTGAVAPCTNPSTSVTISVSDCEAPCDAGNTPPVLNTGVPTIFCDALSQDLNAYTNSTPPAGTVLKWSTNSDPTEVNAHLINTVVTSPGSYFAFFYDEGNDCGSPVLTVNLQQNVTPTITSTTPGSNCGTGSVVLVATASSGATLRWFDTPTSTQVLAVGTSFTTPSITETRDFFVEATANGCTTERLAVTASVNPPSAGTPTNTSACSLEGSGAPTTIDLDSTLTGAESGVWTITSDPSGDLVIGEGNTVSFLGLPDGEYIFTYTTDTAEAPCVNDSVEVSITVTDCLDPIDLALTKSADRSRALVGQEVVFTITVALEMGDLALDVVIEEQIQSGFSFVSADASLGTYNEVNGFWEIPELIEGDIATLILTVSVLEVGDYENIATINQSFPVDGNIANNESSIAILVDRPSTDICGFLFNQFSPNGDNVNDRLTINCIQDYPNNTLEIFDRYGNSIYRAIGYDNSWDGTGNNGEVPKGTYFYILDLGDDSEIRKGWIQIIR